MRDATACLTLLDMTNANPAPLAASDPRLVALRTEAAVAGDSRQVELCDLAMDGDAAALTRCAVTLRDAEAMS